MRLLDWSVTEQYERRLAELNHDMGGLSSQPFSGAKVKGNARPTPVIDDQLHSHESFGLGLRINLGLVAIGGNTFAVHDAFAVLPADGFAQNFFRRERLNSMQDLGLLVAYGVGLERDRRFHRCQADELHHVVRHHVAQSARFIVVAAAILHAHSFSDGDLHVIDVAAVPDGLEDSVGETENQDVLYCFFAQVMVDAVDLLFLKPATGVC